jgi:hypothetical protein
MGKRGTSSRLERACAPTPDKVIGKAAMQALDLPASAWRPFSFLELGHGL